MLTNCLPKLASAVATAAAGSRTAVGTLATAVPIALRGAEAEHIDTAKHKYVNIDTRKKWRASHPWPPQTPVRLSPPNN